MDSEFSGGNAMLWGSPGGSAANMLKHYIGVRPRITVRLVVHARQTPLYFETPDMAPNAAFGAYQTKS